MQRQTADTLAAGILALVLLGGGILYWLAAQQQPTGGMMDGMPGSMMQGPSQFVYAVGTLLVMVVLGGGYLIFRQTVLVSESPAGAGTTQAGREDVLSADVAEAMSAADTERTADAMSDADPEPPSSEDSGPATSADAGPADETPAEPSSDPARQLLEVLPEDERRVLGPVIDSPGITQIALRDRSSFSKSKVSQTVSDLEKRGLLYREKQGRTYRVYPAEDLPARLDTSS